MMSGDLSKSGEASGPPLKKFKQSLLSLYVRPASAATTATVNNDMTETDLHRLQSFQAQADASAVIESTSEQDHKVSVLTAPTDNEVPKFKFNLFIILNY
jgi:hypothetical protein